MQTGNVTTPFGRRPMSLAMLASQARADDIQPGKTVDKWRLYRWLCEARERLGVTDRAMALLNALLSFHPGSELSEEGGLIVFPSNAQLSLRAHGMAEQTIRRHLAVLIAAGLLTRRDSANGKRYARRDQAGAVNDAYGFSLAPLLARSEEIEALAAEVVAERTAFQRLKERLTICRRDIVKLVALGLEEQPACDWECVLQHYRALAGRIPRSPTTEQIADILDEMEMLREEIINRLEMQVKTRIHSGNPHQSERHKQNSNTDSTTESEPLSKKEQGQGSHSNIGLELVFPQMTKARSDAENRPGPQRPSAERQNGSPVTENPRSYPLGMVLQACPEILMYGPGGVIGGWRDLMAAAIVVRSMLGVSPSAYQEACEVLGAENAATVMACILERAGHISSAGGYLRDLTARARRGEFSLGPMLMALMRTNAGHARKVG